MKCIQNIKNQKISNNVLKKENRIIIDTINEIENGYIKIMI